MNIVLILVENGVVPMRQNVAPVATQTFYCVTVDAHTSTSDTFVCLANGLAGNRILQSGQGQGKKFYAALWEACDSLSRQIAADGEGTTKLVRVVVAGTASAADARKAAMAIANSPLVKTAIRGGDPNWRRFISAAMRVERAGCRVGSISVFKNGRPAAADLEKVQQLMRLPEVTISVDLGTNGGCGCKVHTCDLSRQYITINVDYHT